MKPTESVFVSRTRWYCNRKAEKWLLIAADAIAMMAAVYLSSVALFAVGIGSDRVAASWWGMHDLSRLQTYLPLVLVTILWFLAKGHYSKRRPYSNEVREILNIVVVLALVDTALLFFAGRRFSRAVLICNWVLVPCLLVFVRTLLKFVLIRLGGWIRPIVIIGWGENAVETALAFEGETLMGLRLTAFLVPGGYKNFPVDFADGIGRSIPCIPLGSKPELTLSHLNNPHVVIALEHGGSEMCQDLIQRLGRGNRELQVVPPLRGLPLYGMEVNHFFAHEVLLLTVRNNLARPIPQFAKRVFDLTVSLSILILASPLLLWIAAKVSASGRPLFYGHRRIGQYNKSFLCYKFRTMAPNAEQLLKDLLASDPEAKVEWDRDFKLKDDPRITPIGRMLRRTSLDELPQLWNVLKGDMSLVGPRPVVNAELERYGSQVEYYLEARPGITGLWQISGRNDITYDARVYLDAWYVKNWSLFNDIVILFRTVKVLFRKDGAY